MYYICTGGGCSLYELDTKSDDDRLYWLMKELATHLWLFRGERLCVVSHDVQIRAAATEYNTVGL